MEFFAGSAMLSEMAAPEPMADSTDERPPDDLVEAGRYQSAHDAFEHGLVVLATGRPCWLVADGAAHRLLVEPEGAAHVRDQLGRFDRESVGWPPPPVIPPPTHPLDLITPLLWAGLVLAIFSRQQAHPEWVERGALDSAAVFGRGEWWRAATALFLHGDAPHVLSNVLGGIFAFAALITTLGRARAWLWLAITSVWANAIVVTINHPAPYRSLGASTAVFAALGLLAGRAAGVLGRGRRGRRWREILAPLAAGAIVLGLYGAGGFRVDVGAHVVGFGVGAVVGFALGFGQSQRKAAGSRAST
jgi:rhomboid protease GluP